MHRVFDRSAVGLEAGRDLMRLRQEENSVSNYVIDFQILATDSGWEGRALVDAFLHGLSEAVKDELLTRELPDELDRIIAMAIHISSRLEDSKHLFKPRSPPRYYNYCCQPNLPASQQQVSTPPSPPKDSVGEPEVMMVDRSRLTKEKERRVRRRACLYCGGWGHYAQNCPVKGKDPLVERGALVGAFQLESSTRSRTCLPVNLEWPEGTP